MKKLLKPASQRKAAAYLRETFHCSERRAARTLDANRGTLRRSTPCQEKDEAIKKRMRELADQRKSFGVKRIHAILRSEGLVRNHKRTERLYREAGLSLRSYSPKKRYSHTRVPVDAPTEPDECWAMDFVHDNLANGMPIKILTIIDLWDRSSPAIIVDRSISGGRVAAELDKLREAGHMPAMLKTDNGPEFISKALDNWAMKNGVKMDYSRPGRPTDNAHAESFNGRFRDECLNQHSFITLKEARELIENWRMDYNTNRPHGSLGWLSPQTFRELHQTCSQEENANLTLV